MSPSRFHPYTFKNGKTARNRLVVPPMASQTADAAGQVTAATVEHYTRLSRSGAGLIFVEYSFIHPTGRGESHQLGIADEGDIEGLSLISAQIHQAASLAGMQLVHVGGKTSTALAGSPLMGPSPTPVPVKGWVPEVPVAMTAAQIQDWIRWFAEAAERAERAGFDFVELHAAHGYGLNQWLSPLTNQREDTYGGPIENRARLLFEIVEKIKAERPHLLLAVRLPAQDHSPGGLELNEMIWVVQQLEKKGVDLIDVSSGIGGWRRLDGRADQGYLVGDASALKENVSVPVIGVGGIETGEFIDQILRDKKVDFAAVGRAILKNPQAWGELEMKSPHRADGDFVSRD